MFTTETQVKKNKDTVCRNIAGSTYIAAKHGMNTRLDGVASFIWNLIDEKSTVKDIVETVCHEFVGAGEEQVEKDILDLLQQLFSQGLIQMDGQMMEPSQLSGEKSLSLFTQDDLFNEALYKHIPIKVYLALTSECNLHCRHCYATADGYHCYATKDRQVLSFDKARFISDQIEEAGCFFLTLTGGEPLTNKDVLRILDYVNGKFSVTLCTNGTLITAEVADKIQDVDARVAVSLQGAAPVTHDRITGLRGSFEKTIRGIKLLVERDVFVYITYLITKLNAREAKGARNVAMDLGVPFSPSALICPRADGSLEPLSFRVSDEELKYLIREGVYTPFRIVCKMGQYRCAISPKGEVYSCFVFPKKVGDLRYQTFRDVWNSNEMEELRTSDDFKTPKVCSNCIFNENCPRCPATAYFEDGSFRRPSSEACRIARTYYEIKGIV